MAAALAAAAKAKADAAARKARRKKRPNGFTAPYNCYQKFTWVYHTTLTAVSRRRRRAPVLHPRINRVRPPLASLPRSVHPTAFVRRATQRFAH